VLKDWMMNRLFSSLEIQLSVTAPFGCGCISLARL